MAGTGIPIADEPTHVESGPDRPAFARLLAGADPSFGAGWSWQFSTLFPIDTC